MAEKNHPKGFMSCLKQRLLPISAAGFITALIFFPILCHAESAVIQIQHRLVSEALPFVNHFLSPVGKAIADERTNSLIIIDTEEAIAEIRRFLQRFDTPLKRVRVRLRINEGRFSRDQNLSVQGRISGNGWTISSGKTDKDGLEVQAGDSQKQGKQSYEYMIQTTSGNAAYILTGKAVPYRQKWRVYCRRYADCSTFVPYQEIDTGLEVRPVIVGDHAKVEITPRISHADAGDPKGIVRFAAASTRISVPLGQWVTIGGADKQRNEIVSAILAGASGKQDASLSMSILVETF